MESKKTKVISKSFGLVTVGVLALIFLCCCGPAWGQDLSGGFFKDDFSGDLGKWESPYGKGDWVLRDKTLHTKGDLENPAFLAKTTAVADVVIDTLMRLEGGRGGRKNAGVVLRAQNDKSCVNIRYYDKDKTLQLLQYNKEQVVQLERGNAKITLDTGKWYRFKVIAAGEMVMAKVWPARKEEPDKWHLQKKTSELRPGRAGFCVHDKSKVAFKEINIAWGKGIEKMQEEIAKQHQKHLEYVREALEIRVDTTTFIRRTDDGPMRQFYFSTLVDGSRESIGGELTVTGPGIKKITYNIESKDFKGGRYELLIPKLTEPTAIKLSYKSSVGKEMEFTKTIKPARKWTFYMTPHVHYDPGFTALQGEVIETCSEDMLDVIEFCKRSADWPEDSKFRWTIEGTALFDRFVDRRSKEQIDDLIKLINEGRIEVCGYYMNMATEHCGHEQLIRCLYDTQRIRDEYGIEKIDTAMLNDVTGYTWALVDLCNQVGIDKINLRANTRRNLFIWNRKGAVPRPSYWEGPAGSKMLMWYTENYREGNFFRKPGLHEGEFLRHIRRNEAAGTWVDDIQLRMGGDNLPPKFEASQNARAWGEKYVWPRVIISTNRMFMETMEKKYGKQCETFRGDIPSSWADGPGSAAKETGIVRLVHDQLVATEALWTKAWLADPSVKYPKDKINAAYDSTMCFDEHTWGASRSVLEPYTDFTLDQWKYKSSHAYQAKKNTDILQADALAKLSESIRGPAKNNIAVWNTLAWPRTDIVEINLINTSLDGARAITVTDTRTGKSVPAQISRDRISAFFLASDVPPLGYTVYTIKRTPKPKAPDMKEGTIENDFYRITASPENGGLVSWYDKQLDRELLDAKAALRGNQPFYDTPNGGRDAINGGPKAITPNREQPVTFTRATAETTNHRSQVAGPLFKEIRLGTSLPSCPRILQTIRIYNDLKIVDVINTVTKEEVLNPEGLYFAFPFDVPNPQFHFQIADAIMRPGIDQLTYSSHDFYAIQHWADIAGDDFGIIFAPLEGNLISASDINTYKWADSIELDKGHIYSLALNNYWYTNFKGSQSGDLTFRYRLTSYEGDYDPIRSTEFAWQPFHPLLTVWVPKARKLNTLNADSMISMEGDEVTVSCIKVAEKGDAIIVRLLEQRGKAAKTTLKFNLPGSRNIASAYTANAVEVPQGKLRVSKNSVTVELKPNEIATIGLIPKGI